MGPRANPATGKQLINDVGFSSLHCHCHWSEWIYNSIKVSHAVLVRMVRVVVVVVVSEGYD